MPKPEEKIPMRKITKIDGIREELERIASAEDRRDVFTPTMRASWSFTRVLVIGKLKVQAFDFDFLEEKLKRIPTGLGEARFWLAIESTNPESDLKQPREGVVIQLRNLQQDQKAQA
jgi:hypothetical protein